MEMNILKQKGKLASKFKNKSWIGIKRGIIVFTEIIEVDQDCLKREKKSDWQLEKEDLKSYNIKELWQQNQKLGILSLANSNNRLSKLLKWL